MQAFRYQSFLDKKYFGKHGLDWQVGLYNVEFDFFHGSRYVVATPDLQEEDLTTEDETAILASDGLWDVVSNQDAITLIKDIKVFSPCEDSKVAFTLL